MTRGFTQSRRFYAAESASQAAERGVWRCRDVETATPTATPTPADTQTATPSGEGELVVDEVHADAEGNDHENENDEYIVFRNVGDATLDIGGWTVRDEADHTYTVPSEMTVEPGDTVTLYTGCGSDTDTELYWGSDAAIWNNSGDTIYATDRSGETRIEHSYD